jgi:hypothetical protein
MLPILRLPFKVEQEARLEVVYVVPVLPKLVHLRNFLLLENLIAIETLELRRSSKAPSPSIYPSKFFIYTPLVPYPSQMGKDSLNRLSTSLSQILQKL